MAIEQLNFDMRTKTQEAIYFIQEHEPPEGYQVCLSAGGKDSEVVEHLTRRSGVKYDIVYNLTGIDPPEAFKFMKEHYPNVKINHSEMSIWRWIEKSGLPTRRSRWCCEKLKEYSGSDRVLLTGIRAEESAARARRTMFEPNRLNGKTFVHPIFNWNEGEVWEYIDQNHLPYCELYDKTGWDRIGCIMCPMTTAERTLVEWKHYPKIAMAWYRAAVRYHRKHYQVWIEKGLKTADIAKTPDDFWWWWVARGEMNNEEIKYKAEKMGLKLSEVIK